MNKGANGNLRVLCLLESKDRVKDQSGPVHTRSVSDDKGHGRKFDILSEPRVRFEECSGLSGAEISDEEPTEITA